ncbi:ABC transporter ATP-binding protein [Aliikangiella sp. IMCC44359]|uniref:ABC transporter ATP-binding protein n=1 Tax=Aliikangiella sp. IMCC44359 TaxID=3459125 RepID=UPI00403AB0C6
MLEVNQLTRLYGEFKAVDGVSFNIGKGEIVGLLGHNGAGKTTIMKMLSGYLEPSNGNIKINNIDIADAPKKIQQQLGYLPENLPVYPEMTVADYLDYAADLKGLSGTAKTSELKRAIKATELEIKLLAPIATLSRGYKQRVGVAQAILGQPKLLILDEPTNGLDPTQTEHMRQLIKEIAKDATVILSTHIMQEVDAICDRAIIIRNGQIAKDAKLDELRQTNSLISSTSLALPEMKKLLLSISGIESIEELPTDLNHVFNYRIQLTQTSNALILSSTIVKQVIQSNAELYSIHQEQIDLETLFRQVNQNPINTKEVKNAA